ncbi:FAD-dependent oxidoreductase [Pseudomonas sp. PS1]|uniref:FAD-dependent oxidoreductase n=1 Tax=Stutzerimonas marianensis TaxID=2929513 RepID=A0A9X1W3V9_9GAMM|nr:FAD-dependent oxidoreductase [Pseudomonas marianensis]MCJ0973049.1 FAD-dependent oxidoreductase [Pseudomonas marianensis]
MSALSATPDCCWTASAPRADFPALTGNSECDVVVVGAGIVGLSAAMTLCEAGKSVVVLEARDVGGQVTGRSTAKITTQHALIYRHLIDTFGQELAQCYADANREAVAQIRHWVENLAIDCDYQIQSAFAYACSADWRPAIDREAEAARCLGFAARVVDHPPLPFETAGALEFPNQAQFNPTRYLIGLAKAVQTRGGRIHQQTRALSFERQGRWQVGIEGGSVEADQVILATHLPVETPIDLASPTQPRCHVAMAFRPQAGAQLEGMYIGVDEPTHSIRMGRDDQGPLFIVLGPRFRTGQDGDVARRFVDLEQWARNNLPVSEAVWRWCNEDYDTADRVGYVGEPDPEQSPGLFVATGFNGWGISNGTAAGLGIARQIITGRRPWKHLYDPNRPKPDDFNQSSDSQSQVADLDAIGRGEGGVVTRGDEKIAVWRDDAGTLHGVSAACTHMGCSVTWNNADRTWDCPCHGSIFKADGSVIHGPAIEPLPARSL